MTDNEGTRNDTTQPQEQPLTVGQRRRRLFLAVVCILILGSAGTWIALSGSRSVAGPSSGVKLAGGTQQPRPARSRQELLPEFYAALDQTAASIDPADINVAARARKLGGADAVFKWVAEDIRYEHYDGVLRGALGTMVAGAGNSCDKALLLSELLGASGHRAKVRVGRADSALNDRLVELARRSMAKAPADGPDDYLLSRASLEVRSIASAMPVFAAALEQTSPAPVVASFCWVEGEGVQSATVLDPTLQSQAAPSPDDASDALARRRFLVRFSVILETSDSGIRKEELVHASSFSADALGYRPITLTIAPGGDLSASLKTSADPWAELARIDAFYPVISFGDRRDTTKGFSLDGKLVAPNTAPLQGVDSMAGRIGDILGGGRVGGAPSRNAAARSGEVSATFEGVRLDIEVTGPGVQERVSRGIIRGSTLRAQTRPGAAALLVIQQRQFLVPAFAVSRPYGAHLLVEHFRRNRPVLEALASVSPPSELPQVDQYPLRLLALAARQDQGAALIGWRHSGALFRARPAVLAERSTFDVEGAAVARRVTIDIVDTGFGALSRSGSSRLLRALLGAQSTLLETEVMAGEGSAGTIELLQRASVKKIGLLAISSEDDAALARVSIPASERGGLIGDLRAGYAVLTVPQTVSAAFPSYAWWRVDPKSGEVLGVLPTREGGQTSTEMKVLMGATAGAIVGGALTYLNCYFLQDQGGYRCLWSAGCGAIIGGLAGGVGGLFAGETFWAILGGTAAGGAAAFPGEFCEVPPHDPNDNDGDGIPNDQDDDDDNDGRDDREDSDDDNDGYDDCSPTPTPGCQDEDRFPSDNSERSDFDRDGVGDNADTDEDGDGVRDCGRGNGDHVSCDAIPYDRNETRDKDNDGRGDNGDDKVDVDDDGVDDEWDPCVNAHGGCAGRDSDKDGDPDHFDPAPNDPAVFSPPQWHRVGPNRPAWMPRR